MSMYSFDVGNDAVVEEPAWLRHDVQPCHEQGVDAVLRMRVWRGLMSLHEHEHMWAARMWHTYRCVKIPHSCIHAHGQGPMHTYRPWT